MNQIKTEVWNGFTIRFVEKTPGEWWAVLKDIAIALELTPKGIGQRLEEELISNCPLPTLGGTQEMLVVNEEGIYEAVFNSRKPEAKEFRKWVYRMLKDLRQASGLEAFQVFRMLDKEHQKEAMRKLSQGLRQPVRIDFIKANMITNKAVSNMFGEPKALKKDQMSPEMLVIRQPVLDDTEELMVANDKFNLGLSIKDKIYEKYH